MSLPYRTTMRLKPEQRDWLYLLKAKIREETGKNVSVNAILVAVLDFTIQQDTAFSSRICRRDRVFRRVVGE